MEASIEYAAIASLQDPADLGVVRAARAHLAQRRQRRDHCSRLVQLSLHMRQESSFAL